MARLAIGVAGAGIGSLLVGQPGLGFAAGSMLGGLLFPDPPVQQSGPRLDDLRVTSSAYGSMRPILYGRVPVGGNIFDASELYQTKHKESTGGGKGGGGPTVEQTTYTYAADLAVGLGNVLISGIAQIFANEKLIYDDTPGSAIGRPDWLKLKIYLGTETQDPDPTLEAIHGAGNVPGYRGEAYVVFERFELQQFGNRPPQFRFVVVVDGNLSNESDTVTDTVITGVGGLAKHPNTGVIFVTGNGGGADYIGRAYNPFNAAPLFQLSREHSLTVDTDNECGFFSVPSVVAGVVYNLGPNRHFYVGTSGNPHTISIYDAYTGGFVATIRLGGFDGSDRHPLVPVHESNGDFYRTRSASGVSELHFFQVFNDGTIDLSIVTGDEVEHPSDAVSGTDWQWLGQDANRESTDRAGTLAILAELASAATYYFVLVHGGELFSRTSTGLSDFDTPETCRIVYDSGRDLFWVMGTDATTSSLTRFSSYDGDGAFVESHTDTMPWASVTGQTYDASTGAIWVHVLSQGRLTRFETATAEFSDWTGFDSDASWNWGDVAYHYPTGTAWGVHNQDDEIVLMTPDRLGVDSTTLDVVVADIFTRAGLGAGDYDVTDMAAITVRGYRIGRRSTARSAIDSLRLAYLFDIVDTGAKLKCVRRGNASALTLADDDLGAYEGQGELRPLLKASVKDDVDVPQEISVSYLNPDADYERGTQYARRLSGNADNKRDIELPLVLSDDEAAQLADILPRAGAIEAQTYEFDTHLGHLALEGADVVTLQDGDDEFTARVISITQEGPILHVSAAREFDIYSSSVLGVSGPAHAPEVAYGGPTILLLLDIPLLLDADNNAGFYAAASSYAAGWPGCAIYRSPDNVVFAYLQGIGAQATFGFVQGPGADGPIYTWDESLSLTVTLTSGALYTTTEELALQEENAALWGDNGRWELIVFQNSVDNGDGSYTLSRFLRGMRGTTHAMSQHQPGDRFLLLEQSTMTRVAVETANIGSARYFKGVTYGDTVDASISAQILFTPQAIALKPWAPVNVDITGFGGDITITWARQDRIKSAAFQQPPMSESSESYEIDIMDGATVKRTLTSATETATYTSAQQTTDFGAPVASLEVNAYQLSAVVGRGYAANTTI